ncbi:cuticlin-1-like isoform X2 [Stegodyphus dumicola]|nr:cuticlin-1-like isoform X2 [Stegodyphus dumicola]XP_035212619.1 cuticlin-1-like isoform X2 [Stegodyphus dumicola]
MQTRQYLALLLVSLLLDLARAQLLLKSGGSALVSDVNIACNSNTILVTISTTSNFNGMIYPKGLSKNSSCMTEYSEAGPQITYALPLRSCNTMSADFDEGIEYFNTVVIQPHRKLVTSQGRGYHVRCRYQTKDQTITSNFNVSMIGTTPVLATAPMPSCTMKIFVGEPDDAIVAENVKIGDLLSLVISIDFQDVYGIKVTNCLVRDGLNWGEQPLINNEGCPVDEDIMGPLEYVHNKTQARVGFQAHKFPYTSSVYYQCNVKMCLKNAGGCDDVPPICDESGYNIRRRKRRSSELQEKGNLQALRGLDAHLRDRSIEVYSGLYVSEVDEQESNELPLESNPSSMSDDFCVSTKKFAAGIAVAGVLLMMAVMLLVVCILHKRRRRKGASSASSIYSGPYSNHAYSRD